MTEHRRIMRQTIHELYGDLFGSKDQVFVDLGGEKDIDLDILPSPRIIVNIDKNSFPDLIQDFNRPWSQHLRDTVSNANLILCLEVMEHIENISLFISEIERNVSRDASIVISIPFIYHQHGDPFDYRRLTKEGLELLFTKDLFVVMRAHKVGDIKSILIDLISKFIINKIVRKIMMIICKRLIKNNNHQGRRVYSGTIIEFRKK